MARSTHSTYTAADRHERTATRRQRPAQLTRTAAILLSIDEAA